MAEKLCLKFDEITRHDVPLAGGKGANLGDMVRAGLPVPPGFVISAQAYRKTMIASQLDKQIAEMLAAVNRADCNALAEIEDDIRELFETLQIDALLREEILKATALWGIIPRWRCAPAPQRKTWQAPVLPGSKARS